jgi:hypothetical protein
VSGLSPFKYWINPVFIWSLYLDTRNPETLENRKKLSVVIERLAVLFLHDLITGPDFRSFLVAKLDCFITKKIFFITYVKTV